MKNVGTWEVGMWGLLASGGAALVSSFFISTIPAQPLVRTLAVSREFASSFRYAADSLGRVTVSRDVFRLDRRPSAVPYDPSRGAAPLPDGPPKPQLVVTGIVWGDEPEAVMEGLPTATGPRVIRVGDVVGGVTIKRIEQTRVVAVGFDTTWTLTVRVPWK